MTKIYKLISIYNIVKYNKLQIECDIKDIKLEFSRYSNKVNTVVSSLKMSRAQHVCATWSTADLSKVAFEYGRVDCRATSRRYVVTVHISYLGCFTSGSAIVSRPRQPGFPCSVSKNIVGQSQPSSYDNDIRALFDV